jgi:hypothetical protein
MTIRRMVRVGAVVRDLAADSPAAGTDWKYGPHGRPDRWRRTREVDRRGSPGVGSSSPWVETCGWTQDGKAAVGGRGGQWSQVLRSPAVTLVKLPRSNGGVTSCYLAATAATGTFTRGLRLTIIDY